MYDNLDDDRRADTITAANGVGIGMGGDKAYQGWLASEPDVDEPAVDPRAGAQAAAIARLASLYGSQRNPGLRNAIKLRRVN